MWRSIMTEESSSAVGFARFFPAICGAEPCTASNIATPSPRLAEGATPSPPTRPAARSERMSPFMLVITTTSNCSGRMTIWWAQLSTIMCSCASAGWPFSTCSPTRFIMPSVSFMMLALVATVTRWRPSASASAAASSTMRSHPTSVMSLRHCATPGVCMCSMPA